MQVKIPCEHCGADCGKHPIVWEGKNFCCNGCLQVFQLLHENKLYKYYGIEENPGIKLDNNEYANKYAFLDKEEVQHKMYDFYENPIARVTFYIPSIHCASCIWLLERIGRLNPGIKHGSVDFIRKEYTVTFDTSLISLRELVELLVSIHYIPDISLQTLNKKDITSVNKSLIYKIGVAGFIFGNVMLFSLPEYFNGESLGGALGKFFNYMSFVLTVPLVFYSGRDYIVSAWKNIRKGIVNIDLPIALGLITLFLVTSVDVFSGSGPGYSDSLSGFLFFLLIGKWYQSKTYLSLSFDRDYTSYFPVAVTRITDGNEESTLLEKIKVGDRLLIRARELIPADSTLVGGIALIDYSFVTGESTPVKKERNELLYAGGVQTSGTIEVEVQKEVKQSHLTQIWNRSQEKVAYGNSLVSIIDKISVYFTVIVILIALSSFLFWLFTGTFHKAILVFTSVLIVACPCALALSLPFTYGNAMRMLGNKGFFIKNTTVIERLTQINTVVFDKTGTITKPNESKVEYLGKGLSVKQLQWVVSVAKQSLHPLSYTLVQANNNIDVLPVNGFVEMAGRGVFGMVDGHEVRLGSSEFILGVVGKDPNVSTKVYIEIDKTYWGYYRFGNKYRDGFEQLINDFKSEFEIYLLSGDNDSERKTLSEYFAKENMHFNCQPQDKMKFIQQLHKEGRKILMTGDGLNDSGAFMQSDVALSVADDVYHFSPAGDAIIEASRFKNFYKYVKYAQSARKVVKLSFLISFLYNFIGLGFAISGNLSPVVAAILMPISSISVVAFATFTTRWMARNI
jgi:Cu+-exporting ATPase